MKRNIKSMFDKEELEEMKRIKREVYETRS